MYYMLIRIFDLYFVLLGLYVYRTKIVFYTLYRGGLQWGWRGGLQCEIKFLPVTCINFFYMDISITFYFQKINEFLVRFLHLDPIL